MADELQGVAPPDRSEGALGLHLFPRPQPHRCEFFGGHGRWWPTIGFNPRPQLGRGERSPDTAGGRRTWIAWRFRTFAQADSSDYGTGLDPVIMPSRPGASLAGWLIFLTSRCFPGASDLALCWLRGTDGQTWPLAAALWRALAGGGVRIASPAWFRHDCVLEAGQGPGCGGGCSLECHDPWLRVRCPRLLPIVWGSIGGAEQAREQALPRFLPPQWPCGGGDRRLVA